MKAVILAAGQGSRMGKYTENLPKGMLRFNGKSLLASQIETLREAGIDDITIVTGYRGQEICFDNVKYYHNENYERTNMVVSLMCAAEELKDDCLIAYADILYTPELVRQMAAESAPVTVAVDSAWRDYWMLRFGTVETDLETLTVENGKIVELGREVTGSSGLDYRYIGLIRFSQEVWSSVKELYEQKQLTRDSWKASGKPFEQGYMTDLLNELIQKGIEVRPSVSEKQWLEFDTEQDYETLQATLEAGQLAEYFQRNP